jgi:SPP1 family predicted phage head-tail adaptor
VSGAPAIAALGDRVQLQRRVSMPEDGGGQSVAYVGLGSAWARVTPLSARQVASADARSRAQSHAVVLRFRTDIGAGDRIGYRGRWLEVLSSEDLDGRRAFLNCRCDETAVLG